MITSKILHISTVLLALITKVASQGKRGLNYNNATWANYFVGHQQITWGYNWGWPSNGLDSSFEFVPMLWGVPSGPDSDWTNAALAAKNILGFNEPDLGSQANTIPSVAAAGFQAYFQPLAGKLNIGGPAVTNPGYGDLPYMGLGWSDSFLADYKGCQIDFFPIHWYDNASASTFENYVTLAHSRSGGKPIWVTEFMLQDSDAAQISFLEEVMPWNGRSALDSKIFLFWVL
jgi:hypothetical protein